MAEVVKKYFSWIPSVSEDVVAAEIYVSEPGGNVTLASMKWRFESDSPQFQNNEVTIPDDLPGFPQVEAIYELGIMAIDDAGNKADMAVVSGPFDFDAPAPMTGLKLSDESYVVS